MDDFYPGRSRAGAVPCRLVKDPDERLARLAPGHIVKVDLSHRHQISNIHASPKCVLRGLGSRQEAPWVVDGHLPYFLFRCALFPQQR